MTPTAVRAMRDMKKSRSVYERSAGILRLISSNEYVAISQHLALCMGRLPYKILMCRPTRGALFDDIGVPLVDCLILAGDLCDPDRDGMIAHAALDRKPVQVIVTGAEIVLDDVNAALALDHEEVFILLYPVSPDEVDGVLAPGAELIDKSLLQLRRKSARFL